MKIIWLPNNNFTNHFVWSFTTSSCSTSNSVITHVIANSDYSVVLRFKPEPFSNNIMNHIATSLCTTSSCNVTFLYCIALTCTFLFCFVLYCSVHTVRYSFTNIRLFVYYVNNICIKVVFWRRPIFTFLIRFRCFSTILDSF